jgi:signal transduction histidine kinase
MPNITDQNDLYAPLSSGQSFRRKKQLEKDIEHITEEMYRRNFELAETNKTLSLLRLVDALVMEPNSDLKRVCQQITESITHITGYPFAALFTHNPSVEGHLSLQGYSSADPGINENSLALTKPLHIMTDDPWYSDPKNGQLFDLSSVNEHKLASFLNVSVSQIDHFFKQLSLKSVYVVKLTVRHHLIGILVVGFYNPVDSVPASESVTIDRLSNTIGVALDNKLLLEENQKVLKKLKESNTKLLALDEAKDDFISMASHQLRTPLTSVKGYISMVVEGDAGDISPAQKQMLDQAFISCQRMVYIIADLLNVSRLRTGKFVIDAHSVDLVSVTKEEIDQLTEIAKARSVSINFNHPDDFPLLMLDETKTRQIIMNFIDNAIYYTPADGTIDVTLVNNERIIELRVKDNGIGVPKDEQKHLFTKFYRATNARKARPDGRLLSLKEGLSYSIQKRVKAAHLASVFLSLNFKYPKLTH